MSLALVPSSGRHSGSLFQALRTTLVNSTLQNEPNDIGRAADPVEQQQGAYLTLLFVRYRGSLLRCAERLLGSADDAADLVQETYYRVLRRPLSSGFESIAKVYLFQVLRNLAKDSYRGNRRHFATHHVDLDEGLPDDSPTPEDIVATEQRVSALLDAMSRLSTEQRMVLLLSREHGLAMDDVARHLGISKRTAERRLQSALEFLLQVPECTE